MRLKSLPLSGFCAYRNELFGSEIAFACDGSKNGGMAWRSLNEFVM
jgi:hypothetical protein